MLYRGTKSLLWQVQNRGPAAQETRAMLELAITPPVRIVRLSSPDNSVFRCDGVEKDRVRLEI